MQIVIDIPDDTFEILNRKKNLTIDELIILNGTPLPNGHGRLIDADELYDSFIDGSEGYDCQTWNRMEIGEIIDHAPTIIKADKEVENDT